ncbi:MAG: hypothetical protein N2Z82_03125 [Thermomicrobium sp.]|nr:hypothetical protein [Thermomicrobium sp.]
MSTVERGQPLFPLEAAVGQSAEELQAVDPRRDVDPVVLRESCSQLVVAQGPQNFGRHPPA